jgi:hypothetical protein
MRFAGELAAVGTAVCWGSSSSLFTISGRRMGSLVLNRLRLTIALFLLAAALWIVRGSPWPSWVTPRELQLFAASLLGVIGTLYSGARSWVRRAALLLSLSPVFAALQAWIFLGEPWVRAGSRCQITLAGLATVLYSRPRQRRRGSPLVGVLSGIRRRSSRRADTSSPRRRSRAASIALGHRSSGRDPVPLISSLAAAGQLLSFTVLGTMSRPRPAQGAVLGPFLSVILARRLAAAHAAVATSIFSCAPCSPSSWAHGSTSRSSRAHDHQGSSPSPESWCLLSVDAGLEEP